MMKKICKTCNVEKIISDFEKGVNKRNEQEFTYWNNKCKDCDRERVNAKNRASKARHRKQLNDAQKVYYRKNKKKIAEYDSKYYLENRDHIIARVTKNTYLRRKTDPIFKLKTRISTSIANAISKNGKTTFSILPYTLLDLKNHLEKKFEPWMTWENYGTYRINVWDDNDPATWTWQIDHIIPQSKFKYSSIKDKEFLACWDLTNLRPYSAKQNLKDGSRNKD